MRIEKAAPGAAERALSRTGAYPAFRTALRVLTVSGIGMVVANCGQNVTGRSVDPKYGVAPSPRVVADGQPIPKGGGRELIGRPYVVAGRTYVPQDSRGYVREGLASWYGPAFHGRQTANGEVFDKYSIAAAHPTMPLPSYARVTNLKNSRSMIVRVNDRGPFHRNRIMDVSERVAEALDFKRAGTAPIRVEYVGKASIRGSDDEKLLATLRQDGGPASFPGMTAPVMVASRSLDAPPGRPQALAFRSEEPASDTPISEVQAPPSLTRAASPVLAASASFLGMLMPPKRPEGPSSLQPERPLDLDTIPGAATPVPAKAIPVAQLPPVRQAHAALFLVDPAMPRSRFTKDEPFKNMKPQRFVALKGQP